MEKTASFGTSTPLSMQQTPSLLQQRLKYLVESRQEWWIYAIFWKAFKDHYQHIYLSFGDCYFRGLENFQESELLNNHQDSELMIASAAQSFIIGEDVVGGTFGNGSFMWLVGENALRMNGSQRAKEVLLHGMRTLVCVATSSGVVEFGSFDMLKEDWGLVRLTKSLFTPESGATIDENHLHQVQPLAQQESSLLDLQSPCTSTKEDTPIRKTSKKRKNDIAISNHINPKYKDIERARRGKLNQRFYELRSVVPFVTKMDKASLLADAVAYIGELKSKIETLTKKAESLHLIVDDGAPMTTRNHLSTNLMSTKSQVEVKIVGSQAVIRVQSPDADYPTARLMDAMKNLEIWVHHASAANISNMMIQNVVAQIPEGFPKDEGVLQTMILKNL